MIGRAGRLAISMTAITAVAGPALGISPSDVPDAVSLLLEPVAGGNAVGLS